MTQATGINSRLTYVEEQNWGVTPATPEMKVLNSNYGESLVAEAGEIVSNAMNPNRGVVGTRNGQIKVSGSVPFELPLNGIGSIMKGALGSVVTTGPDVNGMYTHVLKRSKTLPSFTFEKGFTDVGQYFIYRGCRIGALDLKCKPDGAAEGSFELMGKNISTSQTTLDATPTLVTHKAFMNFEGGLLEGGASAKLLDLSFKITNGLYDARVVGSRESANIGAGKSEVTGSITVMFEDLTYFTKWLNETETSLQLTYQNGNYSTQFYFPRVKYNGQGSPAIQSQEGIVLTLNFRALIDNALGTDVVVTITNDETTV